MEKRFVIFLVVALAIWSGYLGLRLYFLPPAPPVAKKPAVPENLAKPADGKDAKAGDAKADATKAEDEPEKVAAAGQDAAAGEQGAEPATKADADETAGAKGDATKGDATKEAAAKQVPLQRLTLGSLDPKSEYSMLVTFSNRGAVVERAELNHYRDVTDLGGYLGQLELKSSDEGVRVDIVGPGTPAALATSEQAAGGIQAGDVIESIDGVPMQTSTAVEKFLQQRKPGDKVKVLVLREVSGKPATLTFTIELRRRPLEIVRPESHLYDLPDGTKKILPQDPLSLLLTLESIGSKSLKSTEDEFRGLPSLYRSHWKIEQQGKDFVDFSLTLDAAKLKKIGADGPLKIIKHYRLTPNAKPDAKPEERSYDLTLEVEVQNLAAKPQKVAYRLNGPTGLPTEGWWYSNKLHPEMMAGAGARDVVWKIAGGDHHLLGAPKIFSEAKKALDEDKLPEIPLLPSSDPVSIVYAGVDSQFFAVVILPQAKKPDQPLLFRKAVALPVQGIEDLPKRWIKTLDVSVALDSDITTIPAGGSLKHSYRVFMGPKDPEVLASYGPAPGHLESLIEYGWKYAAWPAVILQHVLYFLHDYVTFGNFGVAIILLTLIVRACMLPFSLKQARSAAKMQELAPEMAKLKEKYADNMEKQSQALRELYAKHNFNPFGGCFLVVFQLPIFVGLYRALSVSIKLRDAPLIPGIQWASNLAGPDRLLYWGDWMPPFIASESEGWLGPYLNILPLITVVLFLIQQKLFTPPATDDQSRMQQQMMTVMTVFMGIMFYKVPAGLCLYFITSSLWGICERKLLPKSQPPKPGTTIEGARPVPTPAAGNGSPNKSSPGKKQKKR